MYFLLTLCLKSNSFIPSNERFRPFKSDIEEMSSIGENVSKVIYKERVKLSLTIHMPNKESVQKDIYKEWFSFTWELNRLNSV